jgi:hypothetical protein
MEMEQENALDKVPTNQGPYNIHRMEDPSNV